MSVCLVGDGSVLSYGQHLESLSDVEPLFLVSALMLPIERARGTNWWQVEVAEYVEVLEILMVYL